MLSAIMQPHKLLALIICLIIAQPALLLAQEEDYNPVTPYEDPTEILDLLSELSATDDEHLSEAYQLHPANTSSPRDTMISFMKMTQRFHDLISSENYSPQDRVEVFHLFGQMQDFFDLRNIAPSLRADYASASAIYLREVIDRVGLPPIDKIPDERIMQQAIKNGFPARWQLPEMPFEIIRVDSGDEEGHYVFSQETIEEVKPLFNEIRDMPYKTKAAEDFYYYFFLTPNPVIPSEWIDNLPDWALLDFYEQTVWQWASMFIVIVLAGLSVWLMQLIISRISRKMAPTARHAIHLIIPAYAIGICYFAYDLIDDKIFITGDVFQVVVYVAYSIILISAIIITYMIGTLVADLAVKAERYRYQSFDSHLMRIGIRIVSIIICLAILIKGLQHVGFSLATVIAGAGVTGLAIALAAQSMLRNIFGGLMILLDKPFRVGQRVKIEGADGSVEEIGLRSTKIRLLNGHVTTIPNERVADASIENIGMRPYIRRVSSITITYDTPQEKIPLAVQIIREILALPEGEAPGESQEHPNERINQPDFPPRVFFNEFNADSLNILMMYWFHPPLYWDFMEFSQRVNEEIMRRFAEAGIEFAFPTQTIHLAGEKVAPFPQIEAAAPEPKPESENSQS
ncbi:mechanosensitive ion channel family protein [Cerasicoccus fimbriatus]|uniref:mechanosensitive ion channel family protein n=1 Tax=Cerasicoccus fimbriatus TaxID=3014554 RepID=UPI0022B56CD0|nr:mechanosensitive ion channel family protein [Cerasicoccus sp. TK19100]